MKCTPRLAHRFFVALALALVAAGTLGPAATFTTKSNTPYVLPDAKTVFAPSFAALTSAGPSRAQHDGEYIHARQRADRELRLRRLDEHGRSQQVVPSSVSATWTDGATAFPCATTLTTRIASSRDLTRLARRPVIASPA